ncbi:hypothetical protein [Vulcanisaeta distributa]|uniref:Uncharacterized protein n=1 Tax=Vulcanisaeta distributa (strain DSM 14429 / JCM 11212 / NBRC 100878 / IC-017) TaxID=572478 RepID=E1QRJ2_VULDI|nr:hypothetical protein [Vulcanisaeta distributa]ADN51806.1 hypothetical protein Vdis_2440 [Vulcanisaeta distributa DSM 14429]
MTSEQVEILGLRRSTEIKGKYVDLVVYVAKSNKRTFLSGVVKCPFTGKEFKLYVTPHTDQVRLGFIQHFSGFNEHIIRTKEYGQWLVVRVEPYSRNSFHKRRYFVCVKCGYKSTRLIDTLLHLITIHGFLTKLP